MGKSSGFGSVLDGEHNDVPRAPFVRSPYNYNTNAASDESGLKCEDESLSIQSARDECDINQILKRVAAGAMPQLNEHQPMWGEDVSATADDFKSAMDLVRSAQADFMALPANIRARFRNDPAEYLAFFEDEKNIPEAIELGLASPVEDLSTGAPARTPVSAVAGAPVEKSDKPRKGLKLPSIPRGYKLVPEGDSGGVEGDD